MSRHLLDTNTCIFFMKDAHGVADRVRSLPVIDLAISEVTLAELMYGVSRSQHREKNQRSLDNFLELVEVLPIAPVLGVFADEKARLRNAGTPVADFDLLIGATAVHHGLVLVTNNTKHFRRIQGIKLVDWVS
ncbi:MAG: PIN domain-containing protein [Flavobacteriales bacterium]|nr:PIN domain-containing protein [Flavobacteriales bacterium]